MTGILMAEEQESALSPFASQIPSAPMRQPSKEDLELAHQLVQHSEGRREFGHVSFRADHPDLSNSNTVEPGPHNVYTDVGQMAVNGVEMTPKGQPSSAGESQHERRYSEQILNPSTMGQVCRYGIPLLNQHILFDNDSYDYWS